ncbi:MAG: ATP-dependent DNA helicase PcrA [Gammaproteobacteria bacterium]|nr:MAG: ATP-dependent DNA helicase PcrA [Gammaproteobacteria bacterium]
MELNQEQTQAAHYSGDAKHLLILAGAGTGKTRTIIGRVIFLVQSGVPAQRLLMLTFTRRAAKEMLARLEKDLGQIAHTITCGTFHHFCLQVMRRIPKAFQLENSTIIDRDDAQSLLQLIRGDQVRKEIKKEFPRAATLLNYISYAKNSCLALETYLYQFTELSEEFIELTLAISTEYENRKRNRQYLDYDDILHLFCKTLEAKPELAAKIAGLFQHILVDEMQDTNPLQWRILQQLSSARLFCVGDDAQSIYAFRGADFKNVHAFSERLEHSAVLKLQENYRSTQPILDIANWLLDESHIDYNKRLVAVRGHADKPVLIDFESKHDEAAWIAADLLERHEGGAPWHQHMVLVRSAWSAKVLEGALIDAGIPYQFIGGTSLLEAAHVKDVLSLCRAAMNRRDELAWIRYLKCWPKIGDITASKTVAALLASDPAEDIKEVVRAQLKKRDDIIKGIEIIQNNHGTPSQAIRLATEHMATVFHHKYDRWESRLSDLRLLADLASRYKDLLGFVETYTLDPVSNSQAEKTETEDAVTVITVHSAKGTEAPVCYCLGVQPGTYPHMRSLGDLDAEEEERRVLYVALTRAQDELIITRAGDDSRTLFHGGSFVQSAGSPYFLEYLPPDLVEHRQYGYGLGMANNSILDELLAFDDI